MKLLINISLLIVALIQISSADEEESIGKSYPLFNFIASKINGATINDLLDYGQIESELWPEYNATISSDVYNSVEYQAFTKQIEEFIYASKKLEEDKNNCDFQMDAFRTFKSIQFDVGYGSTWKKFDKHRSQMMQVERSEKNIRAALKEIDEQLPATIKSFLLSIDDKERVHYKELVKSCEQYLAAKDAATKFDYLCEIINTFPHIHLIKGDHCKWDIGSLMYLNGFVILNGLV